MLATMTDTADTPTEDSRDSFVPPEFPDANELDIVKARTEALDAGPPEWADALPRAGDDDTTGTGSTFDSSADISTGRATEVGIETPDEAETLPAPEETPPPAPPAEPEPEPAP